MYLDAVLRRLVLTGVVDVEVGVGETNGDGDGIGSSALRLSELDLLCALDDGSDCAFPGGCTVAAAEIRDDNLSDRLVVVESDDAVSSYLNRLSDFLNSEVPCVHVGDIVAVFATGEVHATSSRCSSMLDSLSRGDAFDPATLVFCTMITAGDIDPGSLLWYCTRVMWLFLDKCRRPSTS